MAQAIISSPIGPLFIDASERGIRRLEFVQAKELTSRDEVPDAPPGEESLIDEARSQLDAYFARSLRRFELPLDFKGTTFQQRIWQMIAEVPFGETASYAEIASSAGAPNAYRAAGTACGANPVVLVIPCHRIVGSDRGLHGFGGGLDTKVWLLRHEGSLSAIKHGGRSAAAAPGQLALA